MMMMTMTVMMTIIIIIILIIIIIIIIIMYLLCIVKLLMEFSYSHCYFLRLGFLIKSDKQTNTQKEEVVHM
jgi:hypothetical protein